MPGSGLEIAHTELGTQPLARSPARTRTRPHGGGACDDAPLSNLTLAEADAILTETEGPGGGFLDDGSAFGVYSRLDLYRAAEKALVRQLERFVVIGVAGRRNLDFKPHWKLAAALVVEVMFLPVASAIGHIRAGKLRPWE